MPAKIIGRLDWDHFLPQGRPHIAVLGGGFQGVSVALALRERGARVTIFEREQAHEVAFDRAGLSVGAALATFFGHRDHEGDLAAAEGAAGPLR
jgi:glycine/D-amino acid oxidase-like deaminating enzyme